jgi:hypothetical protein
MLYDCNAENVFQPFSTVCIMDVWVIHDHKIHMNHRWHLNKLGINFKIFNTEYETNNEVNQTEVSFCVAYFYLW